MGGGGESESMYVRPNTLPVWLHSKLEHSAEKAGAQYEEKRSGNGSSIEQSKRVTPTVRGVLSRGPFIVDCSEKFHPLKLKALRQTDGSRGQARGAGIRQSKDAVCDFEHALQTESSDNACVGCERKCL